MPWFGLHRGIEGVGRWVLRPSRRDYAMDGATVKSVTLAQPEPQPTLTLRPKGR